MTRLRGAVIAAVVAMLVVVAGIRLIGENGDARESDRASIESLVVPSAGVIRWSPDATRLALIVNGEAVFVRVADAKETGRRGGTVVDAAWMPDATRAVLVEGPIPTGQIVAVEPSGAVQGTTSLQPSIAFGQGLGLAINETGTMAAAIAVRTDAVGGAKHYDLATVDLQKGTTKVFPTPSVDEASPVFIDNDTVAIAVSSVKGHTRLESVDVHTGATRSYGPIFDGPYAALPSGEVVVSHRAAQGAIRLDAVASDGASRVLGVLPRHTKPVAVDRFATRALVRRFGGLGGTRLAIEILSN